MYDDKTIYTIQDENGEKTSITIEKLVADVLQLTLSDVHAWIQNAYYRVATKRPTLSRRQQGNLVRRLSICEAKKSPLYKKMADDFFKL